MAVEVEELYLNLNKLLADICKFLTDEAHYEKLSPYSRKQADELIKRSKKQLQDISKISNIVCEDKCDGGEYVDMERNKPVVEADDEENEGKNNIYSSVEEPVPSPVVIPIGPNPYSDLPARDLSRDIKYGHFSWKIRLILNLPKLKRIYGGIHNNWLLIYSSEKDSKPIQSFDLKIYNAKMIQSKQGRPSQDFELVLDGNEKKSYYLVEEKVRNVKLEVSELALNRHVEKLQGCQRNFFMAQTYKDMMQWVAHINRVHERQNKVLIEAMNTDDDDDDDDDESETYDTIMYRPDTNNHQNQDDEEEEIYDDIVILSTQVKATQSTKEMPPDLPDRKLNTNEMIRKLSPPVLAPTSPPNLPPNFPPLPKLPQPKSPSASESESSIASYDAVENRMENSLKSFDSENSFSQDEEDDVYEAFVTTNAETSPVKKVEVSPVKKVEVGAVKKLDVNLVKKIESSPIMSPPKLHLKVNLGTPVPSPVSPNIIPAVSPSASPNGANNNNKFRPPVKEKPKRLPFRK